MSEQKSSFKCNSPLEKEMMLALKGLFSGYVPEYYQQLSREFVDIAKYYGATESGEPSAALSQPAAQVAPDHSAGDECGGVHLRKALSFYADPERYHGPNQRVVRDHDPFTPEDAVYIQDVTRDRGDIAREALAKATP